jgi:hypothetical protein
LRRLSIEDLPVKPPAAAWFFVLTLLSSPASAQEESQTPPVVADMGLRAEVAGGVARRSLFGLDILGGEVEARLGAQTSPTLGAYWTGSYLRGSTPAGLRTQLGAMGARVDFRPFAHLHLGAGLAGVYFDIDRARNAGTISTLGVDALAFVRWDLWGAAPSAIFVEGAAHFTDLDALHNAALFWGPTLAIGVRF